MTAERGGRLEVLTVQVGPDGEENIEVVNTRAAAGYAQHRVEREYIRKLPSFRLPGAPYNQGSFRAFQVAGDSMEPTLRDGDWLICRAVENWGRDMRDNRVYVVVTEEDVLVKRVINQFNERGQLTLESDNRAFGVRFLDGALVGEVWEGVARLTRSLAGPRVDVPDELARHRADIAELFERLTKAGL
ncbi:S24 family peptidase [Hymenobacter polaris]|uniref:S24 family peptidase n=1 Tax=Hymenobacter polaris TaxID=2682546 RepID=UPI00293BDB5F|nr:S24 family peptidase [Hymenobacter polaris]